MNLLFLCNFPILPRVGGVQRVTDVLAKELIKRGYDVIFLCLCSKRNKRKEWDEYNYSTKQYFIFDDKNKVDIIDQFKKILKIHKTDIIINQSGRQQELLLLTSLPSIIKIITVCHRMPFERLGKERRVMMNKTPERFRGYIFKYLSIAFPFVARIYYLRHYSNFFYRAVESSDKVCFLSEK